MRKPLHLLIFALLCVVYAEEPPVRNRPRIRSYDQEIQILPEIKVAGELPGEEAGPERKNLNDMQAPSGLQNPVSRVSMIPVKPSHTPANQNDREERENPWVKSGDFFKEENLLDEEASMQKEEEEELSPSADWDELQKKLIEQELRDRFSDLTEEEIREQWTAGDGERTEDRGSGGLQMENPALVQSLKERSAESGEGTFSDAVPERGGFVPVLPPVQQLHGEIRRPQRDREERMQLSGSSALLDQLRESSPGFSRSSEGRDSARVFTSPASVDVPGAARPAPVRNLPGLMDSNPAIRRMSPPSPAPLPAQTAGFRPSTPSPSPARSRVPARTEAASPPPVLQNDFRLRSRIGNP